LVFLLGLIISHPSNGRDGQSHYIFPLHLPDEDATTMLSQTPINLAKVKQNEIDKEALRLAVIAELDAITLYEQLAAAVKKEDLKKVLLDVAKEEKTHVGEFQALLLKYDEEQAEEMDKGRQEVEELTER
jgi:rubrerythrin